MKQVISYVFVLLNLLFCSFAFRNAGNEFDNYGITWGALFRLCLGLLPALPVAIYAFRLRPRWMWALGLAANLLLLGKTLPSLLSGSLSAAISHAGPIAVFVLLFPVLNLAFLLWCRPAKPAPEPLADTDLVKAK